MKKKIWIIDDDEEMISAVKLMLKLLDYESSHYLSARSAAQALLEDEPPDLVLLDILMPEVTGFDFLKLLRKRPEWARLPVVMFTTEATDVMVDQALATGADAYVTKPVALDELKEAIRRAFLAHGKK